MFVFLRQYWLSFMSGLPGPTEKNASSADENSHYHEMFPEGILPLLNRQPGEIHNIGPRYRRNLESLRAHMVEWIWHWLRVQILEVHRRRHALSLRDWLRTYETELRTFIPQSRAKVVNGAPCFEKKCETICTTMVLLSKKVEAQRRVLYGDLIVLNMLAPQIGRLTVHPCSTLENDSFAWEMHRIACSLNSQFTSSTPLPDPELERLRHQLYPLWVRLHFTGEPVCGCDQCVLFDHPMATE